MFYNAIHGQLRSTGAYVVLVSAFTANISATPQEITTLWKKLSDDAQIGVTYKHLHLMIDSRVLQRYDLGDPRVEAGALEKRRAAEEEARRKAGEAEASQLLARLAQLEADGVKLPPG